jgi:hypothetical protein
VLVAPLASRFSSPRCRSLEHGLVGLAEEQVLHLLVRAACRPRHADATRRILHGSLLLFQLLPGLPRFFFPVFWEDAYGISS